MGEFRMPSLGADMEVGTIVEWRVAPGATVHRGDIVAVVDTDKATIDVEVFEDGVVEEILVEPGREVPVGTALARLAPAGVASTETAKSAPRSAPETAAAEPPAPPAPTKSAKPAKRAKRAKPKGKRTRPAPAPADTFVRATPRARREAAARGVDLASLAGSGPGGAVVIGDVGSPAAAATPISVPASASEPERHASGDRQAAMRRAIGELMARSKREIPHYYLASTIDLGAALTWLADSNARRPVTERLLPAALLLKASALAAREVPVLNGFWVDGAFRASSSVHLGVAVALRGGGLVAPAIHDADALELDALMAALRDVVSRSRSGSLRSSEMSDPTITVTNLGDQGVEEVFGVIYPPQVALVGFGTIRERPWAIDGLLGVRPLVRATIAADHRASDGHDGARYLAVLDRLLQAPEAL